MRSQKIVDVVMAENISSKLVYDESNIHDKKQDKIKAQSEVTVAKKFKDDKVKAWLEATVPNRKSNDVIVASIFSGLYFQ